MDVFFKSTWEMDKNSNRKLLAIIPSTLHRLRMTLQSMEMVLNQHHLKNHQQKKKKKAVAKKMEWKVKMMIEIFLFSIDLLYNIT